MRFEDYSLLGCKVVHFVNKYWHPTSHLLPWGWRHQVSPQYWYLLTQWHNITTQKIIILLIFFICSLFNNTVSNSDYIAPNGWMVVNKDFKTMSKEVVVASFKVASWHLLERTQEVNFNWSSQHPAQDFNWITSLIEVRKVTILVNFLICS